MPTLKRFETNKLEIKEEADSEIVILVHTLAQRTKFIDPENIKVYNYKHPTAKASGSQIFDPTIYINPKLEDKFKNHILLHEIGHIYHGHTDIHENFRKTYL
jgi:Zn-dependent protease with chaperone function